MRLIFLSSILGIIAATAPTGGPADPNCQFGPQIADKLNHVSANEMLEIGCNHSCSGVLCSGSLDVPMLKIHVSFCFGLDLRHCDVPASLVYYLHIPDKNLTRQGALEHGSTMEIPGPKTSMGTASIIVSNVLEHPNASTIKYGIDASIKLKEGILEMFPYKFSVLPAQSFRVPPCNSTITTQAPPTWPDKCAPVTTRTMPAPPSTVTVTPKSPSYNKPCELGLLQCQGKNELCVLRGNKSRNGLCKCIQGADLSPQTGYCETSVPKSTVKPSTGQPATQSVAQTTTSSTKAKTNLTVIIACSVVGGILLVAVAISVIICIGRRRRLAKYRDRVQLLTDEDDDLDDTNVVI